MDNSNSSIQTSPFYLKDGVLLFLGAGEKYQLDIKPIGKNGIEYKMMCQGMDKS